MWPEATPQFDSLGILLVGTSGTELALLVPAAPMLERPHLCHPWSPRSCFCGVEHAPGDPALLTILVGHPQTNVDPYASQTAVAVVPDGPGDPYPSLPTVTAHGVPAGNFNPFARDVVNLLCSFMVPGIMCTNVSDLYAVLATGHRFRFMEVTGRESLPVLSRRLLARRWWAARKDGPPAALIGIVGSTASTLFDFAEACDVAMDAFSDEARVVVYETIDDTPGAGGRVSLLASPRLGPAATDAHGRCRRAGT